MHSLIVIGLILLSWQLTTSVSRIGAAVPEKYVRRHLKEERSNELDGVDRHAAVLFRQRINTLKQPTADEWTAFKLKYNKTYESIVEEKLRERIFLENLIAVKRHNKKALYGYKTFTMGINKYSDMDHKEFVTTMNGFKGSRNVTRIRSGLKYFLRGGEVGGEGGEGRGLIRVELPDTVDWRDSGCVTPVKDQGQCGSCWAFSSTGSLEGQIKKCTGTLVSLSEQNLIDCSLVWGNNGCEGGLMDNAFEYIKDNYGVDTEQAYPYLAKDGICHYNATTSGGRDSGYVDLTDRTEAQLKEAVATIGPISVAIDASQPSFQQYKSGIYNEYACTQTLDHAVLVVGYGTLGFTDYWLVKNSWGTSWGMNGYIMMSRNAGNQCGIANMASYPTV